MKDWYNYNLINAGFSRKQTNIRDNWAWIKSNKLNDNTSTRKSRNEDSERIHNYSRIPKILENMKELSKNIDKKLIITLEKQQESRSRAEFKEL